MSSSVNMGVFTGTTTGNPVDEGTADNTFQATGLVTAATGAATLLIEVSNDNVGWITAGTITLTLGVTATTDGFALGAAWRYCRARCSSISGTGASVTVTMGL